MMFEVVLLIVFLVFLGFLIVIGYYVYLIGKVKGFLKAIDAFLEASEREDEKE